MKTILSASLLALLAGPALAVEEYKCDRGFFSNSRFSNNEFAVALMPEELFILLDFENQAALTSSTGKEFPLVIKNTRAVHALKDSGIRNHRFELNFRDLEEKGEITWGILHSDSDYQKAPPARYRCVKIR